jgi:hypothetical protein
MRKLDSGRFTMAFGVAAVLTASALAGCGGATDSGGETTENKAPSQPAGETATPADTPQPTFTEGISLAWSATPTSTRAPRSKT